MAAESPSDTISHIPLAVKAISPLKGITSFSIPTYIVVVIVIRLFLQFSLYFNDVVQKKYLIKFNTQSEREGDFLNLVAATRQSHGEKMDPNPYLSPYKINLKCTQDLNARTTMMKFLEGSIRNVSPQTWGSQRFLRCERTCTNKKQINCNPKFINLLFKKY